MDRFRVSLGAAQLSKSYIFKISKYIQPNPVILSLYNIQMSMKDLYENHEVTCIILDTIAFFTKLLQINHIILITM